MADVLNIYIGYDSNEIIAYHVLCQSIIDTSSKPVRFVPINLRNIRNVFERERNSLQSTEFSFSRFLVPYLSNYEGTSLFLDCDIIVLEDIAKLFDLMDPKKAVMVCKHDYVPKEEKKFLGNTQTKYEKKNWSSVMLFNNQKCKSLTPNYVNQATGLELHQFKWLEDDSLIGSLPLEWNWLVGEYEAKDNVNILHYTLGGPYFSKSMNCDYSEHWQKIKEKAFSARLD